VLSETKALMTHTILVEISHVKVVFKFFGNIMKSVSGFTYYPKCLVLYNHLGLQFPALMAIMKGIIYLRTN